MLTPSKSRSNTIILYSSTTVTVVELHGASIYMYEYLLMFRWPESSPTEPPWHIRTTCTGQEGILVPRHTKLTV